MHKDNEDDIHVPQCAGVYYKEFNQAAVLLYKASSA